MVPPPAPPPDDGFDPSDNAALGVKLFVGCLVAIAVGVLLWLFGPRILADNLSFVLAYGGFAAAGLVAWLFQGAWTAAAERRRRKSSEELAEDFE
jgi:hypothetical protein